MHEVTAAPYVPVTAILNPNSVPGTRAGDLVLLDRVFAETSAEET
jgi:hypothetical protein